jgi:hypothetical protein
VSLRPDPVLINRTVTAATAAAEPAAAVQRWAIRTRKTASAMTYAHGSTTQVGERGKLVFSVSILRLDCSTMVEVMGREEPS